MNERITDIADRCDQLWLAMLQHLADLYGLAPVDRLEAVALTRLEDELGEAVERWIEANAESPDGLTPKTTFQTMMAEYQALVEEFLDCEDGDVDCDAARLFDRPTFLSCREPTDMSLEDFLALFELGGSKAWRRDDGSLEIRLGNGKGYLFDRNGVRRLD